MYHAPLVVFSCIFVCAVGATIHDEDDVVAVDASCSLLQRSMGLSTAADISPNVGVNHTTGGSAEAKLEPSLGVAVALNTYAEVNSKEKKERTEEPKLEQKPSLSKAQLEQLPSLPKKRWRGMMQSLSNCPVRKIVICAAGSAFLLIFFVPVLIWLGKSHATPDQRLPVLDNARFIAMFFVVLMHGTPRVPDAPSFVLDLEIGAGDTLALPMFTFLSGFMSQGRLTRKRIRGLVVGLLLPGFFFGFLIIPLTDSSNYWFAHLRGESVQAPWASDGVLKWWISKARSMHIAMYLRDLALWRLSAYTCAEIAAWTDIPVFAIMVPFTIIMTTCGGILDKPFSGVVGNISTLHPFSEGFRGMLPLFVIGLFAPIRQLLAFVPPSLPVRLLGISVYAIWCFVMPWEFLSVLPFRGTHVNPVEQWGISGCTFSLMNGQVGNGSVLCIWSLFNSLAKSLLLLVFLASVCPRKDHWFTRIGSLTLPIYLLHWPAFHFLNNLSRLFSVQWGPPWVVSLAFNYMKTLVLMYFLTLQIVLWMTAPIIHPAWFWPADKVLADKAHTEGPAK